MWPKPLHQRELAVIHSKAMIPRVDPSTTLVDRVFLKSSISGHYYSFPGVSTANNKWTVPTRFQLEDIVGKYLIKLMPASGGGHLIEARDGEGNFVFSEAPVSGFVSPKKEVRSYGPMLDMVHPDGALLL